MDDKNLFGGSSSGSDSFGFPDRASLPDPAASPSTYDDSFLTGSSTSLGGLDSIPDPAASPDSYSDFDIPEIDSNFDIPKIDDDFGMPAPAAPAPQPVNPTPVIPAPANPIPQPMSRPQPDQSKIPRGFDFSSDDTPMPSLEEPQPARSQPAKPAAPQPEAHSDEFSGHYTWNGSQYVETSRPVNRGDAMPRSGSQPDYSQNTINLDNASDQIKSTVTLGIVSIVLAIFGCGCSFISIITAIVGLSRVSTIQKNTSSLSSQDQKSLNLAKTLSIIALLLSFFSFFGNIIGFGSLLSL